MLNIKNMIELNLINSIPVMCKSDFTYSNIRIVTFLTKLSKFFFSKTLLQKLMHVAVC